MQNVIGDDPALENELLADEPSSAAGRKTAA